MHGHFRRSVVAVVVWWFHFCILFVVGDMVESWRLATSALLATGLALFPWVVVERHPVKKYLVPDADPSEPHPGTIAGPMLAAGIGVLYCGLMYLVFFGTVDPPKAAWIVGPGFDHAFGPQGVASPALRAVADRAISSIPPADIYERAAQVRLLAGLGGYLGFFLLARCAARLGWGASALCAAMFGIGCCVIAAYGMVPAPHRPACPEYVAAAAGQEFLTTGDMNVLERFGCSLPDGFRMDRAVRAPG